MRKFLVFLFFIPLIVLADVPHTLHVGDIDISLCETKYTNPSLNVKINNDIFYAPLIRKHIDNALHIKMPDETEYSVYQCENVFTLYYIYDDDSNLIAADENVYLKGAQYQYIDTGFVPNRNTRVVVQIKKKSGEYGAVFGARVYDNGAAYALRVTDSSYYGCHARDDCLWTAYAPGGTTQKILYIGQGKNIIDKNKDTTIVTRPDGTTTSVSVGYPGSDFNVKHTLTLFAINENSGIKSYAGTAVVIYNLKIYDNDVLVRYFVPVPRGMLIKGFLVPENGMWDIVEQKFYGNSGTGEFVYGVDD